MVHSTPTLYSPTSVGAKQSASVDAHHYTLPVNECEHPEAHFFYIRLYLYNEAGVWGGGGGGGGGGEGGGMSGSFVPDLGRSYCFSPYLNCFETGRPV